MQKIRILLCITGGIAAYKAIDLASRLHKLGYEVKCVLTKHALKFIAPASLKAITHDSVHTNMFDDADPVIHISLADWADLIVIAPATADIIAKVANGIADDLLSTLLLAHTKPVLFVPAMNVHMFENIATQTNIEILCKRQHHILQPDTGMLACGYEGLGKYPPNEEVIAAINTYLYYSEDLIGKKVLITAGATIEPIDAMRYISNRSSGKMGLSLARAMALRGAEVHLIHAHFDVSIPHYLAETVFTESAQAMKEAVLSRYANMDWIVKCAAVADYKPEEQAVTKLPKEECLNLKLTSTPDILKELGEKKRPDQKLIGFAAQTEDFITHGLDKYNRKHLDMVCVNHIAVAGCEDSKITFIGKLPDQSSLPEAPELNYTTATGSKFTLAHKLIDLAKTL